MRAKTIVKSRTENEGFTLLEVLVALIILGVALAFLTSTISDSLARTERIKDDGRSATLADAILASVGRDIPLHLGISSGDDGVLRWRLIVTPYTQENDVAAVDQLDLTITSGSNHVLGHWQTLRIAGH